MKKWFLFPYLILLSLFVTTAEAQTPALVQRNSSPSTGNSLFAQTWKTKWIDPTAAGNLIVVGVQVGSSGATISVADDKSNTYSSTTAIDDGTNNVRLQVFYAPNVAANTQKITVTLPASTSFAQVQVKVFRNVAPSSPVDVQTGRTTTGTNITTASMTTTVDNDLIVVFATLDSFGSPTAPMTWTGGNAGSGFTLDSPDGANMMASEYQIWTSHGAITSNITSSINSVGAIIKAVAFKPATAGGDLASGIRVRGINTLNLEEPAFFTLTGTSFTTQAYVSGNLLAVCWTGRTAVRPSTISSSPSLTFTAQTIQDDPSTQNSVVWYTAPVTTPGVFSITQTFPSTPSSYMLNFFDISGANTTPFDVEAHSNGNSTAFSGNINGPSITPTTSNGLLLAVQQQSGETITAVSPGYDAAPDVGVYSSNGVDTDQGLLWYYNPDTSNIQIVWTYSNYESSTQIASYVSQAITLKAAPVSTSTPSAKKRMTTIGGS